ncbi:Late embryogenesis abundant protein [Carex littledalei]|uniref:Late embryogenesis abundant protein n=1 Tax=Carex littledalei TaxID=544730 RepID=A0A833VI26_9POAL|nr:Late embryogenesis abundant protein [Carex littledalei]
MHTKSESDVTSLAPSSPRSPKRSQAYYVQSPSRDSHDGGGYKSSSMQDTPVFNSPNESPTHPSSFGPHSRTSSLSRFSGNLRKGGGGGRKETVNEKGWPECNVIEEEGSYDELDGDGTLSTRCRIFLFFIAFILFFACLCLILWGAARPYKADVIVKSLAVNNFYAGEGTDNSGVPTKMMTVNCSLLINVYNPSGMSGIHVRSSPVNLAFSEIAIATGELKKYYQPRNSHRTVSINLHGEKVPLYGAGAGLTLSNTGGSVPLTINFTIISRGYVVGELVKVTHKKHVSCHLTIDSKKSKAIKFSKDSCIYE